MPYSNGIIQSESHVLRRQRPTRVILKKQWVQFCSPMGNGCKADMCVPGYVCFCVDSHVKRPQCWNYLLWVIESLGMLTKKEKKSYENNISTRNASKHTK
jgi:hypothetical protein